MNYTYIDLDRRSYERDTAGPITVNSSMNSDGKIELSLADERGVFITLKLEDEEAAAISAAATAGRARCVSRIQTHSC